MTDPIIILAVGVLGVPLAVAALWAVVDRAHMLADAIGAAGLFVMLGAFLVMAGG